MKDFQPHKSCLFVLQNVRDIFTSATSFTRKDLRFFLFSIVFIRYFCFTFSAAYFEGPTPPPLRNGLEAADALTDNGHGLPPGYAVGLEWGSRMRTTPPPEMPPPHRRYGNPRNLWVVDAPPHQAFPSSLAPPSLGCWASPLITRPNCPLFWAQYGSPKVSQLDGDQYRLWLSTGGMPPAPCAVFLALPIFTHRNFLWRRRVFPLSPPESSPGFIFGGSYQAFSGWPIQILTALNYHQIELLDQMFVVYLRFSTKVPFLPKMENLCRKNVKSIKFFLLFLWFMVNLGGRLYVWEF